MLLLRASSTPRFARCPASAAEPGADSWNEAADLGTAAHRLIADSLQNGTIPDDAARNQVAAVYGVDADALESLFWGAHQLWGEVGEFFPEPEIETKLSAKIGKAIELHGTADVRAVKGDEGFVFDWKTGWGDADYAHQLLSYALLMHAHEGQRLKRVWTGIGWCRTRTVEARWVEQPELEAWAERLVDLSGRLDEYRLGGHCVYCPRAGTCPALREAGKAFLQDVENGAELTPENVYQAHLLRKATARLLDAAEVAEKAVLARTAGGVDTGEGSRLQLVLSGRDSIDFAKSAEWLLDTFGMDQLADMLTVSKTAVEKAVKDAAPRGQKGAAIKEAQQRLQDLGAVTRKEFETARVVRDGD